MNEESTRLMHEAAAAAQQILDFICRERKEIAEPLAAMMAAGQVQFDLRIADALGGIPRLDLIAVTVDAERVIGSQTLRRGTAA